jgi:hypothetical protein
MDLKEFVQTTLVQIAEGIDGANRALQDGQTGAVVNPGEAREGSTPRHLVRPVEFDVALTVTKDVSSNEGSSVGGKAGVLSIASIRGHLTGTTSAAEREEAISRVKFNVEMLQPGNIRTSPRRATRPPPSVY